MTIHIVGSGGVGFWLVPALLRAGHELTVYDDDTFEGGSGHLRLPKVGDLTTRKVTFARGFCLAVMGDMGLTPVPVKFNGDEVEAGDLVVDCSDMPLITRKVIWGRAKELGARCIRVSYDGKDNTVVVAEGLPLAGRKLGGYGTIPSLGLSFVAGGVGAVVVDDVIKGNCPGHIDFRISIAELLTSSREVLPTSNEGTYSMTVSADQITLSDLLQDAVEGKPKHLRKIA